MIGNTKKTIIIAEACDNHFGSLENAFKMIDLAKNAGADIIKFQHHIPDEEMLRKVPKSSNFKISLYEFLKKYALKIEDHYKVKKYCEKKKIKYLCTPFSYKAAEEINKLGVDTFKIGSGEFLDIFFIEKLLKLKKNIIFSTGMSTQNEMHYMYNYINKLKFRNQKIAFMNCTSEYPPKLEDINLNYIPKMIKKFNKFTIGHSDHTDNIYTSISAVTLGAKIIEKHVFLDGKNYGPDRDVSISFNKLKELVKAIRCIEKSSGSVKKINRDEKIIRSWAHRSVVSQIDLYPGDKITYKDITTKRPGIGIASKDYKKILGKTVKKFIKKNNLILKKNLR